MTGYPILRQAQLRKPVRRRVPSLSKQSRGDDEIPPIRPHEVLVYRVGGQFIVDDGRRSPDDSQVVSATNVSVVNMQQDASVTATFSIDSKDASKFTVEANFVCTVLDAVTVVRNGQIDAGEALLAYLKGYQPLFELGLGHPISEVNSVRKEVGIHIKAYMTIRPPELAGIAVRLNNVQVETPETVARYEKEKLAEENKQKLALQKQAGETALKVAEQNAQKYLGRDIQDHLLDLSGQLHEAIMEDPVKALSFAQVKGEVSASEYAERLFQQAQESQRLALEAAERARVHSERITDFEQHIREKQIDWDREDRVREIDFRHSSAEREAQEAADRRKEALAIELEILREFNKRGLLDNYYPDIDDLIRRIRSDDKEAGQPHLRVRPRSDAAALPEGGDGSDDGNPPDQEDKDLMTEEDYEPE